MKQPIDALCSRQYQAYHHSGRRAPSEVHWVVLHDEEADTAKSAAVWFTNPASSGSTHLCVDDNECYATLPANLIPWGSASAIGANKAGFHIEQAGYARWSAVVWKSHMDTLRRAAYKTALWAAHYNIPLRFVDAEGLKIGQRGITTHAEVSAASRDLDPDNAYKYTHYDPGPFWPRSLFMWLVRYYAKRI